LLEQQRERVTAELSEFLARGLERIADALAPGAEQLVYNGLLARNAEHPGIGVCEWCARILPRAGTGRPRVRCGECQPPRVRLAPEWGAGGPDQAVTISGAAVRVESLCECGEIFEWSGRRRIHCPSCGANAARQRRHRRRF